MEIQLNPKTTKNLLSGETLYDWNGIWVPEALYRFLCLRMGSAVFNVESPEALIFSLTQDGYHRFQNMNTLPNFDWDNNPESMVFLSF